MLSHHLAKVGREVANAKSRGDEKARAACCSRRLAETSDKPRYGEIMIALFGASYGPPF